MPRELPNNPTLPTAGQPDRAQPDRPRPGRHRAAGATRGSAVRTHWRALAATAATITAGLAVGAWTSASTGGAAATATLTTQPAQDGAVMLLAREATQARADQAQQASRLARTAPAGPVALSGTARTDAAGRAAQGALAAQAADTHRWIEAITGAQQTSDFGPRWGRLHAGLDFSAPVGTPVRAMSSGTVTFAGVQGGYGNKIEITYWDGTLSYYGHLSAIGVAKGDAVAPGQVVGASGNTGSSTGPHLHLEVHPGGKTPIDPAPWLRERGNFPN